MRMSESIAELSKSLSKFQGEVSNPSNTAKNPQYNSKYAPLDVVINTVKPLLAKYGLSFIQSTSSEGESVSVTTMLIHESGEWIESDLLTLPAYQLKKGGIKEFNAQGAGSSISYGRRYQLSAILGLSSEDDDDANGQVFGGNGGYRDASNNASASSTKQSSGMSDEEREKRRQEAIAKAQSRAKNDEQEGVVEPEGEAESESKSVEKITPQQEKAIGNLLGILARKKGEGFDKDAFLSSTVSKFGASSLEEVSSDNAKEVILAINQEMRS